MAAFENAVALGVDWIEMDVQTCASGEAVVIYEPDLRLAGRPDLAVAGLPLRELQSIDVGSHFSAEFAGQRVPTLQEVVETLRGRVRFHVEIKEYGARGDGTAARAAGLLARIATPGEVLLTSYNPFSLARAARVAPKLPRGLIHPPDGGIAGPRRTLRDRLFGEPWSAGLLGVDVVLPRVGAVDGRRVCRAHRRSHTVVPWLVDDPERMRALAELGVDGFLTDRPDLAVATLRRGSTPLEGA